MSRPPLAGMGILITRPRPLAATLAEAITDLGGTPVLYPAVEIAPPTDPALLDRRIEQLPEEGLAIFVSPTAVARALPRILARHGQWPAGPRAVAVGAGTARALREHGVSSVLTHPDGADSEHLLQLPELQSQAVGRVTIFRGEGGRELLAQTLAQRGARVDYAECYRRLPPAEDPAPLLARWREGGIQAVTVTSAELLANLFQVLGEAGAGLLRRTPLFVPHERIAQAARARGVADVTVTAPGDAGLLAGLRKRYAHV